MTPEHSSESKPVSLQELREIEDKLKVAFDNGRITEEEYDRYRKQIEQARQALAPPKSDHRCVYCGAIVDEIPKVDEGSYPKDEGITCLECSRKTGGEKLQELKKRMYKLTVAFENGKIGEAEYDRQRKEIEKFGHPLAVNEQILIFIIIIIIALSVGYLVFSSPKLFAGFY